MRTRRPGLAAIRFRSCAPAGAICRLQTVECNATDTCCAGNVQQNDTCHQDNLGIPRCTGAGLDCTDPSVYTGMPCASSADCCGLPCTPAPGSENDLRCGDTCKVEGQSCTNDADCCAGLPCTNGVCGQPQGCSSYGQACDATHTCCNNVPCTGGVCIDVIQ